MIINPNYIFIHIPKTGGTYIRYILETYFCGQYLKDQYRFHAIPKIKPNQVIILALRDPMEWYVSLFCHIVVHKNVSGILPDEHLKEILKICGNDMDNIQNFQNFLSYIYKIKDGNVKNGHWWGRTIDYNKNNFQYGPYSLLYNFFSIYGINYIINTKMINENIENIFEILNKTKKSKYNIQKFKNECSKLERKNIKEHLPYKQYYTSELENLVKKKEKNIYNAINK